MRTAHHARRHARLLRRNTVADRKPHRPGARYRRRQRSTRPLTAYSVGALGLKSVDSQRPAAGYWLKPIWYAAVNKLHPEALSSLVFRQVAQKISLRANHD